VYKRQAWGALGEDLKRALVALRRFDSTFTMDSGIAWLGRALGVREGIARRAIEALHTHGWIERAEVGAFNVTPVLRGMLAAFDVEGATDSSWREHVRTHAVERAQRFFTVDQAASLEWFSRHTGDVARVVLELFERDDERELAEEVLVELRHVLSREEHAHTFASLLDVWEARAPDLAMLLYLRGLIQPERDTAAAAWQEVVSELGERAHEMSEALQIEATIAFACVSADISNDGEELEGARATLEHGLARAQELGLDASVVHAASGLMSIEQDPERRLAYALEALEAAERTQAPSLLLQAYHALHRAHAIMGNMREARVAAQRALEYARAVRDAREPMMLASLGYLDMLEGEPERALGMLNDALEHLEQLAMASAVGNTTYLIGVAHACALEWDAARAMLERALTYNRSIEMPWNIHLTQLWLGVVLVGQGMIEEGRAKIELARAFFEGMPGEMTGVLEILELMPDVVHAGWVEESPDAVARVSASLDAIPEATRMASGNAWTVVTRMVHRAEEHVASMQRAHAQVTLTVSPDYKEIEVPGQGIVSLGRSKKMRALLGALIEHHAEHPGEPMEAQELFERGWPGEQPEQRTGMMRLYVAINKLRKTGLDEFIETAADGYQLRSNVRVVVA